MAEMTVGELRQRLAGCADDCEINFVLFGLDQFHDLDLTGFRHYSQTQDPVGQVMFDLQIVSGYPPRASEEKRVTIPVFERSKNVGSE